MNWNKLDTIEALNEIISKSFNAPLVIFKHSARCSISSMALSRMASGIENTDFYLIDIIAHRNISNKVSERFNIIHHSPQVFIIHRGKCIYTTSHLGISSSDLEKQIALIE